jgi:hypothetical protein
MSNLPFLGQLATQGILGILLVISIVLNWYFIRKIQQVNDLRVQDAQDITNKLLDPIGAIRVNSELLISLFTKFLNSPSGKQI